MLPNYWNEFEYSKLKLLINPQKVESIFSVLNGRREWDELPPISVELHLTDLCNLNCPWCTDQTLRKNQATQRMEDVMNLFQVFAKHRIGVTLEGGGEPTLHPEFAEIVAGGVRNGLHLGLITNGVNDCSQHARFFKWMRISLDASTAEEFRVEKGVDRFDQVMENIARCSQARNPAETHLGVGYVLTRRNIQSVPALVAKLDTLNVDYIYLRPVEEAPDLVPTLDELFTLKKALLAFEETSRLKSLLSINERLIRKNDGLPCVAHSLTCIIQANGDVALCEKRRGDHIVFGNTRQLEFETIWRSPTRIQASRKLLNPACQSVCDVCRITAFNRVFWDVNRIHTTQFI